MRMQYFCSEFDAQKAVVSQVFRILLLIFNVNLNNIDLTPTDWAFYVIALRFIHFMKSKSVEVQLAKSESAVDTEVYYPKKGTVLIFIITKDLIKTSYL